MIYDKITYTYCVINEFNPAFETQNMGNKAFENASFGNGNEDYSCLWAKSDWPFMSYLYNIDGLCSLVLGEPHEEAPGLFHISLPKSRDIVSRRLLDTSKGEEKPITSDT